MKPSILSIEKWRIAIVIFIILIGGLLTDAWLISIALSLFGYIVWMYYKIYQFYTWIINGTSQSNVPDSDGIWDKINYKVLQDKNKSSDRKKRMNALLKRSQSILKGFPYAAIVLNQNNEVDWSNSKSSVLLNIVKNDRGQRINNLIRSPKLYKLLSANEDGSEIEIESPKDSSTQLVLKIIAIGADSKLLIARDITQRNKTLEMRKSFISNASHELRTPLTVISGYLEMIKEDKNLPKSLSNPIDTSYEQTKRMQNIIEDLLTLSRLESTDDIQDISTSINMEKVINHVCQDLNQAVTIEINTDEVIVGVETEIISLCTNLIQNAIFYTPKGTKIIVRWHADGSNKLCLDVQDFGKGIPNKHLAHLTERFYRVDKGRSKEQGGTGLGLAIVSHIAQRHNAVLTIDSKVGSGSTFKVCFLVSN
ncbi:Phosphate regulon sensor protein PhoR (SphS) (EC 2.7.13.3) [uncultured Gammaproteobacteria bacterium]|jgi:two-component system phosphate regulon sensor histidine kinase PhoR|uniref:phosphate regulon sensor histidine kinase PhoR n=1 Tax=thiotrophic endosymbiont of Bathymodiolus puteoserpentis (Logatchev) TaxID=343240 RepID=UPI0010B6D8DF|nr:phosphate regulon sensor histidine kinase PhoR [thiotrophic endosymbiont of Bathymodiolus puteoserpentis (Logatchev)]CAC9504339.1 Phosphate regulon sensor protein PhoR (SphS) (EC 2.7.13.3) [uncultured Gammaproteobacteria bacterium]CAC9583486.1 Phosphate regulon sensor protein PhoR (SphS) (EC 2.7.13.3) [uncultured Gammaproteobacteria bacterium]CAC9585186.1 Phosphate regulon sensor protein PhoR (SphS) (EC 2.7.13.3) [uncultured Gammaproteobacteria bacterium]CAC9636947.1 Phosphate regulon sensor